MKVSAKLYLKGMIQVIRSLYTAVSGMIAMENKQNTVVNNMANANTIGFKSDSLITKSFNDVLLQNKEKLVGKTYVAQKLGKLSLGVAMDGISTDFSQGDFKQTQKETDFAINGSGFFAVQTADGVMYTRDGQFRVNNEGNLVNNNGDLVLGLNNRTNTLEPINVGNSEFVVDSNNNVVINGVATQRLAIADFDDYTNVTKIGDNYYKAENPVYNNNSSVKQGFLETSNVNVMTAMTDMISVMRSFETNQKFVTMLDETLDKAANQIGKV